MYSSSKSTGSLFVRCMLILAVFVLGGIIASFIAQGIDPFKSTVAGVKIHGLVGDAVTEKYSMMGNTPSLMLGELPSVLSKFE